MRTACTYSVAFFLLTCGTASGGHPCEDVQPGPARVETGGNLDIRNQATWRMLKGPRSASEQLTTLYLTLFNTGQLVTRQIQLSPEGKESHISASKIPELLTRERVWLGGTMTLGMEALLCDLNRHVCKRSRVPASVGIYPRLDEHVAGFEFSSSPWALKSDSCLNIPDLALKPRVDTRDTIASQLKKPNVRMEKRCQSRGFKTLCFNVPVFGEEQQVVEKWNTKQDFDDLTRGLAEAQLTLTPIVNLALQDLPLPWYYRAASAPKYNFMDAHFEQLRKTLGDHLILGTFHSLEHAIAKSEPMYPHQKQQFDVVYGDVGHLLKFDIPDDASDIVVAVFDGWANLNHCDIKGVKFVNEITMEDASADASSTSGECGTLVEQGYPEDHGTHVLGLLAALSNDKGGLGLLGSSKNAKYFYVPIDYRDVYLTPVALSKIADDLKIAVNSYATSVVNLSWSYQRPEGGDPIKEAINKLDKRSLFVAAAGRQGFDTNEGWCGVLPACLQSENVLSVVAVELDPIDKKWKVLETSDIHQSNFGERNFGLSAPGEGIISTVGGHELGPMSGSSQAVPFVTAVAALLRSKATMLPGQLKNRLIATSTIKRELRSISLGGLPNATLALNLEFDYVRLANGCEFLGDAKWITQSNGERGDIAYQDDEGSARHVRLSELKRLFSLGDEESVIFYELDDVLKRAWGPLVPGTEKWRVRFDVEKHAGACAVNDRTITVAISEIADWVPGE